MLAGRDAFQVVRSEIVGRPTEMSFLFKRAFSVSLHLACGRRLANTMGMKHSVVLLMLLTISSCVRKVEVRAPTLIKADRYVWTKGEDGRVYIVTTNTKDFEEAMKAIRPGPASVDKLDLWVITPMGPAQKPAH
jgi:hypothetical protein